MKDSPFSVDVVPDWEGFIRCIMREGTPERVHLIELFLDGEVRTEICRRFGLLDDLDPDAPHFAERREIALQSFLGYDYVRSGVEGTNMPLKGEVTEDSSSDLQRQGGRNFMEEHKGPITTWEEFEAYPWPDVEKITTHQLEWYEENLPENMCIIGGLLGHFAELLTWLMGYETLCFSLYDQRDLVGAIRDRITATDRVVVKRLLQFDRVKFIWGSDDMGFRSATLISPDDLREFVLPGHKLLAEITHKASRVYLLHSCGNLSQIMDDLINDVRIDAKHSFEDTFETVLEAKERYGDRIAVLGGIDMDFICRASEEQVRERVRETLSKCMEGGGYCLGTGNSVANYVPVENYLAMLDEGRKFTG